jgi:hypothetical protein
MAERKIQRFWRERRTSTDVLNKDDSCLRQERKSADSDDCGRGFRLNAASWRSMRPRGAVSARWWPGSCRPDRRRARAHVGERGDERDRTAPRACRRWELECRDVLYLCRGPPIRSRSKARSSSRPFSRPPFWAQCQRSDRVLTVDRGGKLAGPREPISCDRGSTTLTPRSMPIKKQSNIAQNESWSAAFPGRVTATKAYTPLPPQSRPRRYLTTPAFKATCTPPEVNVQG